ncbi:MAG: ABC transporter substrate-binding protein [Eubacteriaceae bacterium]|jgi:ABC-type nitrate/sulfonate/bicarbonate transport system substrate-binding protein|nr:ABC transporter substrate-binding protein [Eubacteriaceae bacterium]
MEKVKVVLDWYPNNNHAGFFLADSKGLFKDAGLDVEIEGSANGSGEAGDADILIASEPDILTMKNNGKDITAVARIFQQCDSGIVSLKSAGIEGPKDLEGKRLAKLDAPWFDTLMEFCLQAGRGDYSKVNVVDADTADIAKVLGNDADAAWVYGAWELSVLKDAGLEYNYFNMEHDVAHIFDFAAPCIAASGKFIEERPETLRTLIESLSTAYKDIAVHPRQSADYVEKYIPQAGGRAVVADGLVHMSEILLDGNGDWGKINHMHWAKFADFMCEKGLIADRMEGEYTNDFNPAE